MKSLKNLHLSIYRLIIYFIALILGIFALLSCIIGYRLFTTYFTEEYNASTYKAALIAQKIVDADRLDYYLQDGGDESEDYKLTYERITDICNTQDISLIYVIKPEQDYKNFTAIIDCVSADSGYTPWEPGTMDDTPDALHEEAYRRIMNQKSRKEVVIRPDSKHPHTTVMIPAVGSDGQVRGIICAQRFLSELDEARQDFVYNIIFATIIMIIVIMIFSMIVIKHQVVKPIREIVSEANRFAKSGTKGETELSTKAGRVKEIHELAKSIDKMEDDTVKYIEDLTDVTKKNERINTELDLATKIQNGILPKKDNVVADRKEFDLGAYMKPAKKVGGDFYDFFMVDDTHLAILIADVSDKGYGAAMFMAVAKTLIKTRIKMGGSARDIISYADRTIAEGNAAGMFVTAWLGIIDLETGHVNACNAGHDYPAVMKSDEGFSIVKTNHGPPIAFLPGANFVESDFDLRKGGRIFLYTDGLNEAKSVDGGRFGTDRILEVLNNNIEKDNDSIIEEMRNAVEKFAEGEEQFDDMTMLSFTYYGKDA